MGRNAGSTPRLWPWRATPSFVKVLTLYNEYRQQRCGEYRVVIANQDLLTRNGVDATLVMRSSEGLDRGVRGKVRAFARGTYSRAAYRDARAMLDLHEPDVVHVHNLYPLLSPLVLVACRDAGVRTVMTVHNYRHSCPTSHHYRRGQVCEKCSGGHEWQCLLRNCRGSLAESFAYSLRAVVARKLRLFLDNTDLIVVGTRFAAERMKAAGFDGERLVVMPTLGVPVEVHPPPKGHYVAYAGRMTPEKGVITLLAAARRLQSIDFRLAGDGPLYDSLVQKCPQNARLLGFVDHASMPTFYGEAMCLVIPSEWYEMRPLVICEAMAHGLPVVASRIGGLGELVEDNVTGLLFTPGDEEDLAASIERLAADAGLRDRLGDTARQRVVEQHGEDHCFEALMSVYESALAR